MRQRHGASAAARLRPSCFLGRTSARLSPRLTPAGRAQRPSRAQREVNWLIWKGSIIDLLGGAPLLRAGSHRWRSLADSAERLNQVSQLKK